MIGLIRVVEFIGWRREIETRRQAGLRFSEGEVGGVCGRMFLAWMSGACDAAEKQCSVLAEEDRGQQGAGSEGEPVFARQRLAGFADMGVPVDQAKFGPNNRSPQTGVERLMFYFGEAHGPRSGTKRGRSVAG